jgi:CDP-diacylglycerol--glycerol-3-phosphate 3-phosphatidyltransferase
MTTEPVPLLNMANVLTFARFVLVPIFVLMVLAGEMTHVGWRLAACGTFVVASFTDYVDGWVARSRNLVTSFGKVADPIADKALTGAALVLLSLYGKLPWWVTILILVREWGVTGLRFWALRYGVIGASRGGKIKTALQILAIAWYLCPLPQSLVGVGPWLMAAAVIVTVVTGVDYVWRAVRVRREATARLGSAVHAAGSDTVTLGLSGEPAGLAASTNAKAAMKPVPKPTLTPSSTAAPTSAVAPPTDEAVA